MDRHKKITSAFTTLNAPATCPVCQLIHQRFGKFTNLYSSVSGIVGRYQLEVELAAPQNDSNVRNVHELMDWLRISELNRLIGFAAVIQQYPTRVVRVLSSFDRILSWMERKYSKGTTSQLRELYRALEAHVWEINPLLLIKTS